MPRTKLSYIKFTLRNVISVRNKEEVKRKKPNQQGVKEEEEAEKR